MGGKVIISDSGTVIESVSYYIGVGTASFLVQIAVMVLFGGLTILLVWKRHCIDFAVSLFRGLRKDGANKRNKRP